MASLTHLMLIQDTGMSCAADRCPFDPLRILKLVIEQAPCALEIDIKVCPSMR
jgi:hypothetical protein